MDDYPVLGLASVLAPLLVAQDGRVDGFAAVAPQRPPQRVALRLALPEDDGAVGVPGAGGRAPRAPPVQRADPDGALRRLLSAGGTSGMESAQVIESLPGNTAGGTR